MNKKVLSICILLSIIYLMLGVVHSCGEMSGTLVIKPYPIIENSFGHGEGQRCRASMPEWVVEGDFIEISFTILCASPRGEILVFPVLTITATPLFKC